jgi:AAA+ superfamily predicted ATPase
VKSFAAEERLDQTNIRQIFDRARRSAPCVLVLEDLDSLITDANRSYFLNEMDGFALNAGIVTLGTTNHPERLDPAIVERPSRFDRKYHFGLPASAERAAYLRRWSESWKPEMRLSEQGLARIAELTSGFSFAYLKELALSCLSAWVDVERPEAMDGIMTAQALALLDQMSTPALRSEE